MDFDPKATDLPQGPTDTSGVSRISICATQPETMTLAALFEAAASWDCRVATDVRDLRSGLLGDPCEVIVVPATDLDDELASDIRRLQPNASIVLAAPSAGIPELTRAMRFGASDFLQGSLDAEEVEARMTRAAERSNERARRERAMRRIAELGRRIEPGDSSAGSSKVSAPDRPEDHVAMCSEFRTLLRQELDVEDLLRTALEYLLVRTGPTNAAVFLAGGDGQFGLGAYVNYEHARRTVEPMLQRLGDEACPRIAGETDILKFEDVADFVTDCDLDAAVDAEMEMVAVPCHHEGECLAVMYLFRSVASPFSDEIAMVVDALRPILAGQLATLIRIHNRLEQEWPEDPADDVVDDWDDLAA